MIPLLLALLALSPSIRADDAAPAACQTTDDCTVIEGACPGSWEAVLKTNADARAKEIARSRDVIQCVPPPSGDPGPTPKALCVGGRCRLVRLSTVNTRNAKDMVRVKHFHHPLPLPSPSGTP